jgi:hypothetical protein
MLRDRKTFLFFLIMLDIFMMFSRRLGSGDDLRLPVGFADL